MIKHKLLKIKCFTLPITSFFVNVAWWVVHPLRLYPAITEMRRIKKSFTAHGKMRPVPRTIEEILGQFTWKPDGPIDWIPWVVTLFAKNLTDDCDGAANLGKWLLKSLGIKSDIWILYDPEKKSGHAVCVGKNNNSLIISNGHRYVGKTSYSEVVKKTKIGKVWLL